MIRIALCLAVLGQPGRTAEVAVDGRTFRVPEGFVVEKVAGPPLADRPIVADFDELGRLYVADSSGSNAKVKEQEAERTHRIVRLEDADGDGTFETSVVFADRMMFPEGAMWLRGSLYVAAPPSIWKLTDTNGDGRADRREEWFQGKTLTGCANDLHGPYAGPDGRVYWCKGAFAPQAYDRPGRPPLVTRAAHIFRAKADGSEIEPVMTGGMDNPVEVAFTPEGERIFTTTFLQHPGGGRRDGLIHALYGGVYGKVHDVIDGHPRTGPDVLPPLVHLGPAAPSGLARAESDALGSRDALFTACFNLRKVTRTRLTPEGGSFAASTDDLLATDDLDFHPTDVLEDADGSLLVVDTGGWYKLCCPTSQLVKPDVLGAIYRVRRRGMASLDDPRGLKLSWGTATADDLVRRLGDPRPRVRRRAVAALADRGEPAVPAIARILVEGASAEARRDAAWAACRIDGPAARAASRIALASADPSVRQVAIHSAGLWRDPEALPALLGALEDGSPAIRRAAAEALGRIGDARAVPALLQAAATGSDWALRHSLTYALIEIADTESTRAGLDHPSPLARAAAAVALDQSGRGLDGAVAELMLEDAADPTLRKALLWAFARHPEWGAPVSFLGSRIDARGLSAADREELEGQLAGLGKTQGVQKLLAGRVTGGDSTPEARSLALRAMARSGLKAMPEAWGSALEDALGRADEASVRQAIATLRAFDRPAARSPALATALRRVAEAERYPDDLRLSALAALPSAQATPSPTLFAFLRRGLSADQPASTRSTAADLLARSRLDANQFEALLGIVASASPLELPRLLDAFDGASGLEGVGPGLVEALGRNPARSNLRVEALKPHLERFGPGLRGAADSLYRAIEADAADRRGRLDALAGTLAGGDVRRGQAVFNGPKASCVACHAIGYVGGKLGPDLTKVGEVRSERDLLESIVEPSASFVRSYEPVSVATRDGRSYSGLLKADGPDGVVLAVAADRDETIPRARVEAIAPGTVSVMPAGLDRVLNPGELADLIAFLKACR